MRTRWHVDDDWAYGLLLVWLVLGVVGVFVVTSPHPSTAFVVLTSVWWGIVIVPSALFGLTHFLRFLWRERPRRMSEPVTTDLRETV